MTTKMLAACMLAAITLCLLSCGWFNKKSKVTLAGRWKITAINDSSASSVNGKSFFSGFNADSTNAVFSFSADSVLTFAGFYERKTDTAKYYTDEGLHNIYVHDDNHNANDTFPVVSLTDTTLTVVKDSVHITLKKLP